MAVLGAVIQARIWAKRFPAKVLADLGGETVLQHVIRRAKRIRGVDRVIVATPDLALVPLIRGYGAEPFLGDENNVLRRFVDCSNAFGLDAILRLTADCPFVDPGVCGSLVNLWYDDKLAKLPKYDYVSNVLERSYPYGLDCEIVSSSMLKSILKETKEQKYIEHVTLFIREHLDRYRTANLKADKDYTSFDWRLDSQEDLPYLQTVYKCGGSTLRDYDFVLKMYSRNQYGFSLRVLAESRCGACGNTAANVRDAGANSGEASYQSGSPWYERRSGDTPSGS